MPPIRSDGLLDIGVGHRKWGQQADRLRSGGVHHEALLEQQAARHVRRVRQVEADHQAEPARLEAEAAEAAGEPLAAPAHRVEEAVAGRPRRARRWRPRRSPGRPRRWSRGRRAPAPTRSPGWSRRRPRAARRRVPSPPSSRPGARRAARAPRACRCGPCRTGSRRRSGARRARRRPRERPPARPGRAGGCRTRPGSARAARPPCARDTAATSASRSFRGTTVKPGTSGANGACFDSCGVAESAPIVRPWKPPSLTTNSPPGRRLRASFSAHSIASAPELHRKTRPPSDRSESRFASVIPGSV